MIACRRGFTDIVKYLLHQEDIEYNLVDKRARTAIMVAKTEEIESLFLDKYGTIREKNNLILDEFRRVELIQAAAHGNLEKVKAILLAGKSSLSRQAILSDLANLTDLKVDVHSLLLLVSII